MGRDALTFETEGEDTYIILDGVVQGLITTLSNGYCEIHLPNGQIQPEVGLEEAKNYVKDYFRNL